MIMELIESAIQGKVQPLLNYINKSSLNRESFISIIRHCSDKDFFLKTLVKHLLPYDPSFCFSLIYDEEDFQEEVKQILESTENSIQLWNTTKIENALNATTWMKQYMAEHFNDFLEKNEIGIIDYLCRNIEENKEFVNQLNHSKNKNLRLSFYSEVAVQCPEYIPVFLPDIFNLLQEDILLDEKELCRFTSRVLRTTKNKTLFLALKDYILSHYERNDLASFFLDGDEIEQKELEENIETYYNTSFGNRLDIFIRYHDTIQTKVFDDLEKHLTILLGKRNQITSGINWRMEAIFYHGLDRQMEEWMDKYLAKSKTSETGFIGMGTTTDCYRLGDYVLKIRDNCHSPSIACPNLYLILPNLEESFVQIPEGNYLTGISVQKYLSKTADHLPPSAFEELEKQLLKLGYRATDVRKENCRFLDSYMDADCSNPLKLPKSFKENPLVLIDRELVFPIEKEKKKSLFRNPFR